MDPLLFEETALLLPGPRIPFKRNLPTGVNHPLPRNSRAVREPVKSIAYVETRPRGIRLTALQIRR
jgi:hypothetical protein